MLSLCAKKHCKCWRGLQQSSLGIKPDIPLHSSLLIKALTLAHIWKEVRPSCCLSDTLVVANGQFPYMWQFTSVTTHTQMPEGTEVPVRKAGTLVTYNYKRSSKGKKQNKTKQLHPPTTLNKCFKWKFLCRNVFRGMIWNFMFSETQWNSLLWNIKPKP